MKITSRQMDSFFNNLIFSVAEDENDLGYEDPFVTAQQKKRDDMITSLLSEYVKSYKKKVKHSNICRYFILVPCLTIIIAFAVLLVILAIQVMTKSGGAISSNTPAFITACISFISLIIGILTIITKYFFPENDEQYITAIVESIQKNDLENKRENAKNKSANETISDNTQSVNT